MASLIQYRNQNASGHILTIEDPIEFTYRHDKSIIGQREVGFDTLSYANAMREAMREAPDVVMVGEVRNSETVESALSFADTGHLVITTLHATDTIQAIERMIHLLPPEQRSRILMDISLNLRAVIAQRLIPNKERGYSLATEVLINTPYCAEVIRKGQTQELRDVIAKGKADGMHSFDQALADLYQEDKISRDCAVEYASSKNNLEWMLNFKEDDEAQSIDENGNGAEFTEAQSELPTLS